MKITIIFISMVMLFCDIIEATPPQPDNFIYGVGRQGNCFSFNATDHVDYIAELERICMFLDEWQVKDTEDPEFGGMIEDEFRTGDDRIVQSDNTQEAIYVWSRQMELTGDVSFHPNILDAWTYLDSYPAWEEESDYYRVWNCGWGIRCGIEYQEVFEDDTFLEYVHQCANYVIAHAAELSFTVNPPGVGVRNALTVAWATWNLSYYSRVFNDDISREKSIELSESIKNWLESDDENIDKIAWALSGGIAATCVLEVYFEGQLEEATLWMNTYLQDIITYFDPLDYNEGAWVNAWNSWQALAQNSMWRTIKEFDHRRTSFEQSDYLRLQDIDQDGGIPSNPNNPSNEDESWVSTYVVLMGFAKLEEPPYLALQMSDVELQSGDKFRTEIEIFGPGLQEKIALIIALEIGGEFYFFPSFSDSVESITIEIPLDYKLSECTGSAPGWTPIVEIPQWPAGIPAFESTWWGVVTDQTITTLLRDPFLLHWKSI